MSHAADLPPLFALLVGVLVVLGALLALIGSFGLLRLRNFYDRVHAPTLGTTLGMGFVLIASMVLFSVLQSRPVLHELLIGILMTLTTPVTFILLVRAALHRDRADEHDNSQKPEQPNP